MKCPQGFGTFDLRENSENPCFKCDLTQMVCLGGNLTGANRGFYQYNLTADIFTPCSPPEACLGNFIDRVFYNHTVCAQNYTGNLCSSCAEGYLESDSGVCEKCSDVLA